MWIEWKTFQGCFENKKKKKQHEIEFHNSIQDWVFTTVYQFTKVPGKTPDFVANEKSFEIFRIWLYLLSVTEKLLSNFLYWKSYSRNSECRG